MQETPGHIRKHPQIYNRVIKDMTNPRKGNDISFYLRNSVELVSINEEFLELSFVIDRRVYLLVVSHKYPFHGQIIF